MRSKRSGGRDARPSGSRWHVCIAACSSAPSSPPIYGSIAGRLFGSSGPCRSEGWQPTRHWKAGKSARICGRGIYRALGAEDIRHRRTASDEVLLRRLLSLDYVLEHTGLSWLPTEPEKVAAFEELGIERRLLPSRLYRGAAGNTRRYFPLNCRSRWTPSAHCSSTSIPDTIPRRRYARGPWHIAASGRPSGERGRSIEVVAVVRTVRELQRALTILENWTNTSTAFGPSAVPEPDSAARREIARIEQAIRAKDERVLEEYGDLAGLPQADRRTEPTSTDPRLPEPMIHGFATWRSRRLPGGRF